MCYSQAEKKHSFRLLFLFHFFFFSSFSFNYFLFSSKSMRYYHYFHLHDSSQKFVRVCIQTICAEKRGVWSMWNTFVSVLSYLLPFFIALVFSFIFSIFFMFRFFPRFLLRFFLFSNYFLYKIPSKSLNEFNFIFFSSFLHHFIMLAVCEYECEAIFFLSYVRISFIRCLHLLSFISFFVLVFFVVHSAYSLLPLFIVFG